MKHTFKSLIIPLATPIKLIIYYFMYQLAFGSIGIGVYMLTHRTLEMPDTSSPDYMHYALSATLVGSLAMVLHLAWGKYAPLNRKNLSFVSWKVIISSILFVIGMSCWSNFLVELLELPDNFEELFGFMIHHPVGIVSIVLIAPLLEEMLFRGAIERHLLCRWENPWWGIVVSALIFGLVHGNPIQIPFAFLLGVAFGWVYYRTGSLLPSILMHFVNNGSAVLLSHLSDNPDLTLIEALGHTGAWALALAGVLLTLFCIGYIRKKAVPQPVAWCTETEQGEKESAFEAFCNEKDNSQQKTKVE